MSGNGRGRRWGWHRLDPEVASSLVEDAEIRSGDLVLDLGAGDGVITAALLEAGARVIAIELHPGRAERLRARFAESAVTVVERDLRELYLPGRAFKVVANPPFELSTPLVRRLAGARALISADLVLQRQAAQRLVHTRSRHRLSLGAKIGRSSFSPPPAVDAVVVRFR